MNFARTGALALLVLAAADCTGLVGDGDYYIAGDATDLQDSTAADVTGSHSHFSDASSSTITADGAEASICPPTQLACGGTCVDSDIHNCGACGHDCSALAQVTGPVSCDPSGACSFAATSCAPGWAHCTSNPDDGCEADVTQATQCGSCGTVCPASAPLCASSGGRYSCATSCPAAAPTLCTGTCVDTSNDARHCGTCTNACTTTVPGALPACSGGACTYTCPTGWTYCNGACTDLLTDNSNCGGCGIAHACPNGSSCQYGVCASVSSDAGTSGACGTCSTPGACCGDGGCEVAHTSGLTSPSSYYSCSAVGSTTQSEAVAACSATGGLACSHSSTVCGGILGFGGTATDAICGTVAGACYCWTYSGTGAGHVTAGTGPAEGGAAPCTVACSGTGQTWN